MKKRFLSVLVAAAMVFALTPVLPVGADDGYIEIEKISHPGRGCCTDGRPLTAFASNVNALGPGSNSNNIWVEGKTRVAVTSDGSDNIAEVLFALNSTEIYWVNIPDNISLQDLSGYDILFINCGTWFFMSGTNLRAYVEQGGIIYASDFALGYIQDAFPERNITRLSLPPQHTVANIVNPVLQAATGLMQINVFFDLENWRLVNSPLQNDVDVHLTGTVTGGGSTPGMIYPFTFSFEHGENGGMVFFTSFHQRANNTIGMRTILENLVLNLSLTNDINNLNSWVANPNNNYNNMFPMPGMLEDGKGEIILGDAPEGGGFAVVNADTKGEFTLTLTAPNGTTYTNYRNGEYIVNSNAFATASGSSLSASSGVMGVWSMGEEGLVVSNSISGPEPWKLTVANTTAGTSNTFLVGIAQNNPVTCTLCPAAVGFCSCLKGIKVTGIPGASARLSPGTSINLAATASAKGALVKDLAGNLVQFADNGYADDEDWLQSFGGEDAVFDDGLWKINRVDAYDGVDIKAVNLDDGEYFVEVEVMADTPTTFTIETGSAPYEMILSSAGNATSHTFEYKVSVENGQWQVTLDNGNKTSQDRIRIQTGTDAAIDDFCIKSIKIFKAVGGGSLNNNIAVTSSVADLLEVKLALSKPSATQQAAFFKALNDFLKD